MLPLCFMFTRPVLFLFTPLYLYFPFVMVLNCIYHVILCPGVMVMTTQNCILTGRKGYRTERTATGILENPFISWGEINRGQWGR